MADDNQFLYVGPALGSESRARIKVNAEDTESIGYLSDLIAGAKAYRELDRKGLVELLDSAKTSPRLEAEKPAAPSTPQAQPRREQTKQTYAEAPGDLPGILQSFQGPDFDLAMSYLDTLNTDSAVFVSWVYKVLTEKLGYEVGGQNNRAATLLRKLDPLCDIEGKARWTKKKLNEKGKEVYEAARAAN